MLPCPIHITQYPKTTQYQLQTADLLRFCLFSLPCVWAEAVALFCYQVKKWIGAFAAALGGLDTLVFAGGIGENAPVVRARICEGLAFLGIKLEEKRNAASEGVISAAASRVAVRVIHTDEEWMIAKTVCRVLGLG